MDDDETRRTHAIDATRAVFDANLLAETVASIVSEVADLVELAGELKPRGLGRCLTLIRRSGRECRAATDRVSATAARMTSVLGDYVAHAARPATKSAPIPQRFDRAKQDHDSAVDRVAESATWAGRLAVGLAALYGPSEGEDRLWETGLALLARLPLQTARLPVELPDHETLEVFLAGLASHVGQDVPAFAVVEVDGTRRFVQFVVRQAGGEIQSVGDGVLRRKERLRKVDVAFLEDRGFSPPDDECPNWSLGFDTVSVSRIGRLAAELLRDVHRFDPAAHSLLITVDHPADDDGGEHGPPVSLHPLAAVAADITSDVVKLVELADRLKPRGLGRCLTLIRRSGRDCRAAADRVISTAARMNSLLGDDIADTAGPSTNSAAIDQRFDRARDDHDSAFDRVIESATCAGRLAAGLAALYGPSDGDDRLGETGLAFLDRLSIQASSTLPVELPDHATLEVFLAGLAAHVGQEAPAFAVVEVDGTGRFVQFVLREAGGEIQSVGDGVLRRKERLRKVDVAFLEDRGFSPPDDECPNWSLGFDTASVSWLGRLAAEVLRDVHRFDPTAHSLLVTVDHPADGDSGEHGPPASGAMDGDLVRATENSRGGQLVEGILRLRYVPSLDYVQVHVLTGDQWVSVDAATVEVVRAGAAVVSDEDLEDPLRGDPAWRRVTDLDQAIADGLVTPARQRHGGTWEEMDERLRQLAAPLVEAGWSVFDKDYNSSAKYGDAVHLILNRDDETIDLEYDEDGYVVLWPVNFEKYETDDWEPEEPLATIKNATAATCHAAFVEVGWLRQD